MLTIQEIERLRRKFREEKKNVAQIAKEMNISRATVYKYLKHVNCSTGVDSKTKRPSQVKLEQYREVFVSYLNEDATNFYKQRHTATRMYERICEEHPEYDVGKDATLRYCSQLKKEYFDQYYGFLPLNYEPGMVEVDFGDCQFIYKKQKVMGKYLCLVFPESNAVYLQLMLLKNAESSAKALINIFEFIGGVPHTIWFDNDTAFISIGNSGGKKVKVYTNCFKRFRIHYDFKDVFLPPFAPSEKGDVEAEIRWTRRKLLVPLPEFDDIDEYNKKLLERCAKYNERENKKLMCAVNDAHFRDVEFLNKLPPTRFDPCTVYIVRADLYGRFSFNTASYYLHTAAKNMKFQIKVCDTYIEIYTLEGQPFEYCKRCPRVSGKNARWINWPPYIRVLANKPAALMNFPFLKLFNEKQKVKDQISELKGSTYRDFMNEVADLMEANGVQETLDNIEEILKKYPDKTADDAITKPQDIEDPLDEMENEAYRREEKKGLPAGTSPVEELPQPIYEEDEFNDPDPDSIIGEAITPKNKK